MNEPSLALQKAVHSVLATAMAPVKVYDNIPPGALFPYVSLGDDNIQDDSAECIDGTECYVTIHLWSRKPGKVEVKQLTNKAASALIDDNISIDGYSIKAAQLDMLTHLSDPDGITSHSVLTVRYRIELA